MADRYKIVLKAFIPFSDVPDPEEDVRGPVADVATRAQGKIMVGYSSRYHGDDHQSFDGPTVNDYRVRRWIEFDWDGDIITNVTPNIGSQEITVDTNAWHQGAQVAGNLPVYGATSRKEVITYHEGGTYEDKFITNTEGNRAVAATRTWASQRAFIVSISSGNPGVMAAKATDGAVEPFITSVIHGTFDASGVILLAGFTRTFPSYGLSIARFNGGAGGSRDLLFEKVIFDAFDASGVPGAVVLAVRLLRSKDFGAQVAWK